MLKILRFSLIVVSFFQTTLPVRELPLVLVLFSWFTLLIVSLISESSTPQYFPSRLAAFSRLINYVFKFIFLLLVNRKFYFCFAGLTLFRHSYIIANQIFPILKFRCVCRQLLFHQAMLLLLSSQPSSYPFCFLFRIIPEHNISYPLFTPRFIFPLCTVYLKPLTISLVIFSFISCFFCCRCSFFIIWNILIILGLLYFFFFHILSGDLFFSAQSFISLSVSALKLYIVGKEMFLSKSYISHRFLLQEHKYFQLQLLLTSELLFCQIILVSAMESKTDGTYTKVIHTVMPFASATPKFSRALQFKRFQYPYKCSVLRRSLSDWSFRLRAKVF